MAYVEQIELQDGIRTAAIAQMQSRLAVQTRDASDWYQLTSVLSVSMWLYVLTVVCTCHCAPVLFAEVIARLISCGLDFKLSIFFFFFQAEDGIRDHCVTGVQTCALPI